LIFVRAPLTYMFTVLKITVVSRVTQLALHLEDIWGNGGVAPLFLDLGTRWKLVVGSQLHVPATVTLRHFSSSTHCLGSCMTIRGNLQAGAKKVKEKNHFPFWETNDGRPACTQLLPAY
jgi:hypothetical protein